MAARPLASLGALDGFLRRDFGLVGLAFGIAAVLVGQFDAAGLQIELARLADVGQVPGAGLIETTIDEEALVAFDLLVDEARFRQELALVYQYITNTSKFKNGTCSTTGDNSSTFSSRLQKNAASACLTSNLMRNCSAY